jgi:hypothetical protein
MLVYAKIEGVFASFCVISQKSKFINFYQIFRKNICIYNIEWIHLKYIFYGESTDIDSVL